MQETESLASSLASLPEGERLRILQAVTDAEADALLHDWRFWARPKQLAPDGDWRVWVLRAGRGFGKTRAGAGWVQERAEAGPGRWAALIAKTPADARDYMIEGPGGLLRNAPPDARPNYEPSKRRLTWPNGAWATIYSSEEPEQLRGFSGDTAWLDEFGKWRNPRECWDNLAFGMREASADRPRICVSTTPRPLAILQEIEARASTVTVVGASYENRDNLDPGWFDETLALYEGTRIGRQEIHAEILTDVPGALWTRDMIERGRVRSAPELVRVVVGVDPAVTGGESADQTGIVVAGLDAAQHVYVLDDRTLRASPETWAKVVIAAYTDHDADRVIAETNNGGDLVEAVLRTVDRSVSYKKVTASRGKRTRAEPVAALYEQGRAHHVGGFPDLEDQMVSFVAGEVESPDRMDALVWALTELAVTGRRAPDTRRKVW